MTKGSGPAGEITMDDIRQRLTSLSARLAAMRDQATHAAAQPPGRPQPGQPPGKGAVHGQR